jgi:hypothetical protein
MNPTLQQLKDAASALPARERAELAEFLLRSLDGQDEARAEGLALAEQRMAEVLAGEVAGASAGEVSGEL